MLKVLVSACLLGEPVRFDAGHKFSSHPLLRRWEKEGRLVSVCPEMLGGLGTPRPPAEIFGSEVVTVQGEVVTSAFQRGAHIAAETAASHRVAIAILKSRSPSCGSGKVYDGTFSGTLVDGDGVTTALLRSHGIAVFDEQHLEDAAEYLATLERGAGC